jgi:ligand-binding sensor domain-containing protein
MKIIVATGLFLCIRMFCFSQGPGYINDVRFDQLSTDNGLSFAYVSCLLQDSRGFLWVGTLNGLNRYDGKSFLVYRRKPADAQTLADNEIRSLAEDRKGNIWIGTTHGVSVLNPSSGKVTNFYHADNDSSSLGADYINHVFCDRSKTIWTGNPAGLDRFDEATHRFRNIDLKTPEGKLLTANCFCESDATHFWIGTNDGLLLFDKKSLKFEYHKPDIHPFLITHISADTLGNLWIGTWAAGAFRYNVQLKKFFQYKFNFNSTYTSATNIILCTSQTATSENDFTMWFGTTEGLIRMDVKNKIYPASFEGLPFYKNDPAADGSLSSNNITALLSGSSGILWVGSGEGLNKTIPSVHPFGRIKVQGSVFKVLAEKNDNWITSWYGNGLTHFDSAWNEKEHFIRVPPESQFIDNSQVSGVCRDELQILWLATFHGLVSYDQSRSRFTTFLDDEKDSSSLSENRITCVFHDSKNRLWVGTYSKGLNMKQSFAKEFIHFNHRENDSSSLCSDKIWLITEDQQGRIWIGTNSGISRYEEQSRSFSGFLNSSTISAIYADSRGRIWASTKEGFYEWGESRNNYEPVLEPAQLNDALIYGILDDGDGNLWLSTQKGLINYIPETQSLVILDKHDGLPFDDLNGSFDKGPGNLFYIGGTNEVITFDPSALKLSFDSPMVYITGMKVFERPLPADTLQHNDAGFSLPYDQNMVSFQFTSPAFVHASRREFAYRMIGLENDWHIASADRQATYSSLPPGSYTFEVKATGIDGRWGSNPAIVHFTITPPFWKTWWFALLVALVAGAFFYLVFTNRISRIRKREEEKTNFNKQVAELEMKALRAQMNPHFIFNALNSIQECVVTANNDAAYAYLSKFSKLVRLILENSEQSLIPVKKEIDALLLYLELESLRFQHFNYSITVDKSIAQESEKIPSMLIQPFAENSIKHGLATRGGNGFLKIELHRNKEQLQCIIEDNGIGREKAAQLHGTLNREHKSRGTQITQDRLNMIGAKNNIAVKLRVIDLYDEKNEAAGTRVEIEIPFENINAQL